jgi:hypothetical protein
MKRCTFLVLMCVCVGFLISSPMPEHWTRYTAMKAMMDSLAVAHPNLIRVDSLGVTDTDMLPIWGAKISANAHERRDVPRILVIGQIHAEEVIGVEITLRLIRDMVTRSHQAPYNFWLNNLEIWVVPTMNPEGLQVVLDGWDTTFRKNKRDNTSSGTFTFVPGIGGDIDGVDLNRNWDVNWVHGDTLFSVAGAELYDYYRGAYPYSEGEVKAIRDLAYREQFVFGVTYHSSRTGNFSEQVMIPYNFKGVRPCPDWDINFDIGSTLASLIRRQNGIGFYMPSPAMSRKGDQHTWFYSKLGTIFFLIEAGTSHDEIQPNQALLNDTIDRNNVGLYWLFNRAMSTGNGSMLRPMLTGIVRDAVTTEPLVAEVIVHGRASDALSPRLTNADHGRFWRPLLSGGYQYTVRKKGYEPFTESVLVGDSWRQRSINLVPLQPVTINLHVVSGGAPTSAFVSISDPTGDDEYEVVDGFIEINTFVGTRTLTIIPDSGIPWQRDIEISSSMDMRIDVSVADVVFYDDFSTDLSKWTVIDGPWQIAEHAGKRFLTDNWGGAGLYALGCDVMIRTTYPISIPSYKEAYLLFEQNLYTEWEHDFVTVSVSTDNQIWHDLYKKAGKYDWWHYNLIDLSDYAGKSVYLRFRLTDDTTNNSALLELNDPGWSIANVRVLSGTTVSTTDEYNLHRIFTLSQNFPNPFNPQTRIAFSIKNTEYNTAIIDIFNIKGQKVQSFTLSDDDVRNGFIDWNAEKLSSGIYFYRLVVDDSYHLVKKALLLK